MHGQCDARPTVTFPAEAGTQRAYPRRDGQAELTEIVYRPKTVTHPGINRARRRVTTLIETNALPLSQTAIGSGVPVEILPLRLVR